MSVLAMFFAVIAVTVLHISNINGMRDSDIENVLSQLHKKSFSLQRTPLDQSLERDEHTGYDSKELLDNIVRNPQVRIGFPYKDKKSIINEIDRREKRDRLRYLPWKQINNVKPAWLKQNYPLNNMEQEDDNTDFGDFSKIYLVLDPDADMTESDVRDLSNMVSSVLTSSNTPKKYSLKDRIQKERRFRGFLVKDNRRRMRDSIEKYAEKDSIERDYKPKRPRVEYSGRGGGRTAIPYMGHRGDIFERE